MDYYGPSWRSGKLSCVKATPGLTGVYEFGVFAGSSTVELSLLADRFGWGITHLIGFDSFDGIPKELAEPIFQDVWDPDKSDYYRAFSAAAYFDSNPEMAESLVRRAILPYIKPGVSFDLVRGFFDQSLTHEVAAPLPPALYVDIDVDIYSSAKTALDWCCTHGIITTGTYIGYDDWGGTPGHTEMADGESRAHREVLLEQYGLNLTLVASVNGEQVVFRVE